MNVHAQSITAGYGKDPVIHGITTGLDAGDVLGILGPNGSGKTTLLRTLAGLLPVMHGQILLDGRPAQELEPTERAKRLAYVSSAIDPLFDCSISELVMLGRTPHLRGLGSPGAADRAAVEAALSQAHLQSLAAKSIHACSAGERQRSHVAMALAQQAPVLLLDEPVAHLDIQHAIAILSLVRNLAREHGHAVAITLHDLNQAAHYCSNILILKNGRQLAQGLPAEVLTPELLTETYDHPIRVDHTPDGWWIRPGKWGDERYETRDTKFGT